MNIAIIPARGGSKRIPNKNIRIFAGKPVIAYSIETCRSSGLFEHIMVSTDSAEIADVAKQYGAEIPFIRPAALADDYSTTDDVLLHTLAFLQDRGQLPELCCCVYATAPFLTKEHLHQGLSAVVRDRTAASFAVAEVPCPILRAFRMQPDGRIALYWPEHERTRSQDIDRAYYDAGQFYWLHSEFFLECKTTFPENSYPVVIPRYRAHDLDTEADWETAEIIYKALHAVT
jgi:pseudaminic acid cytidylyltransferase